jgi:hypothetical protein
MESGGVSVLLINTKQSQISVTYPHNCNYVDRCRGLESCDAYILTIKANDPKTSGFRAGHLICRYIANSKQAGCPVSDKVEARVNCIKGKLANKIFFEGFSETGLPTPFSNAAQRGEPRGFAPNFAKMKIGEVVGVFSILGEMPKCA